MKTWNAEDKLSIEKELLARGCAYIAGVDEVGRGPLAGPEGVDDSKKLSAKRRETLAALIKERAFAYTVYELNEKTIDEINILQATRLGMKNALLSLPIRPDAVITDGNMTLDIPFPQRSIVRGDALSYSIGAASIVAKVYRDALMEKYAETYPAYGFERNKGYGTAEHIKAIKEQGLCPIHRRTFTKKLLAGGGKSLPKNT